MPDPDALDAVTTADPAACADAYCALRARVSQMMRDVDPADLDQFAPATPEWRVRDVLAHMVGVNTDILGGVLDGVATDAWTNAQVDARRNEPVEQLLAEWDDSGSTVEANAAMLDRAAGQWLADACTHEHDIRHALSRPGARDSDAVALAFVWSAGVLGDELRAAGAAGLCLQTEAGPRDVGADPRTGVQASRFELVRAMAGRRSRAQIEAYAWDGPPRAEALPLAIFALRADDLVE